MYTLRNLKSLIKVQFIHILMYRYCMIKNNVLNLLKKKSKSKYWLYNQMGMSSQNFNKMANNETKGISYETLETICLLLECSPSEVLIIEKYSG